MINKNEEITILEKEVFRQRKFRLSHMGLLTLTNKKLKFQPKNTYLRDPLIIVGMPLITVGILFLLTGAITTILAAPQAVIYSMIIIGITTIALGSAVIGLAYRRRDTKETTIELKEITDVKQIGSPSKLSSGFGGPTEKISIKIQANTNQSTNNYTFKTSDGQYEERFLMTKREEFLEELKFTLKGDPTQIPPSLISKQEEDLPKFAIPKKYPGALVRLQKNYLSPKICCMCSEPASENTITAQANSRIKKAANQSNPYGSTNTPKTHPFPICNSCYKIYKQANTAGSIGGVIGLLVGGAIFVLLFITGLLTPILAIIAGILGSVVYGFSDQTTLLLFLLLFAATAALFGSVGWMIAKTWARDAIATRKVPPEKKEFYKTIASDKGIRIKRHPGFVAFGFLSKEFAQLFSQMNQGYTTAIETSPTKKKKQ